MDLKTFSKETIVAEASKALNDLFSEQKQQGKDFLFLSSGGSSLSLLDGLDSANFGLNSTIGVLDERYSLDPNVNNLAQLQKSKFYQDIIKKGARVIDTTVHDGESPKDLAVRFEKQLKDWVDCTHGVIIASVGVGPDAHTSGIMPYPENKKFFDEKFNDKSHWVTEYDAEDKNPHRMRVTTTFPFLKKIDHAVIFISGESKKEALKKLLAEEGSLYESPCRIWRGMPEANMVQVFTDQVLY